MSRYFARLAQRTGLTVARTQTSPATAAPSTDIVQQDMYVDAPSVNTEVSAEPSQSIPVASKATPTSVSTAGQPAQAAATLQQQPNAENQSSAPSVSVSPRVATTMAMDVIGPKRIAPEQAAFSTHASITATVASQVVSHSTNGVVGVVSQGGAVLLENRATRQHVPSASMPKRSNTGDTGVAGEPMAQRAPSAPMSETVVNAMSRPIVSGNTKPVADRTIATPATRKPAFTEYPTSTTVWPSDPSCGSTVSMSPKPVAAARGIDVRIGSVRLEIHTTPAAVPTAPVVAPAIAPAAPRGSPRFAARRHYLRG
jgi:hypothetical protein